MHLSIDMIKAFLVFSFSLLLCISCSKNNLDRATLRLIFTCDTIGKLEPCGCFTGQYGGLARIQTAVKEQKESFQIRVDAGNAISGTEDYDFVLYKQVREAFNQMGFHAMNVGVGECLLTKQELLEAAKLPGPPLISANLVDNQTAQPILQPFVKVDHQGTKILITGVVDPNLIAKRNSPGIKVTDMKQSLQQISQEEADIKILLAYCNEEKLKQLANDYFEFDFIIGGKVRQPLQDLLKVNRSYIFYTTNEAKNVGLALAEYKEGKIASCDFDIPLLFEQVPEDVKIKQLVAKYRQEVKETKLKVDDPGQLSDDYIPGVKQHAEYVGTQQCAGCHAEAFETWKESGHAKAFQTLKDNHAEADPKCISCHVVGFGEKSGYERIFEDRKLVDVGCESCHGPGSQHVQERLKGGKVLYRYRPLGAGDCQTCHYGEFSRPFEWDEMWPLIEHGKEKNEVY